MGMERNIPSLLREFVSFTPVTCIHSSTGCNGKKCFVHPKRGPSRRDCIATSTGTLHGGTNFKGQRPLGPQLKLWPQGCAPQILTHVVISALIIERKRLALGTGNIDALFR
jgi:hypothetical protein